jgi:hypothetical protein
MTKTSGARLLVLVVLCAGVGVFWLRGPKPPVGDTPYHLIEEGLFLGSSVGQPPPHTSAVVNLCGREDRYPVDAMLWDPILEGPDGGKKPDLAWLNAVVGFVDAQRRAHRTVYVHCLAGVSRSAMVVTAYLMSEHGWGRDTALAHVKAQRPCANPAPDLMQLLADWERAHDASRPRPK